MIASGSRTLVTLLAVAVTACSGPSRGPATEPTTRTVTEADLAALPVNSVTPGARLCLATGYDACPLRQPIAARLDADRIALWEPGHTVGIWQAGDTALTPLGSFGSDTTSQYQFVIALRAKGRGYEMIEAQGTRFTFSTLDRAGRVTRRQPIESAGPFAVVGFSQGAIVRQAYADWSTPARGELRVTRLRRVSDSLGSDLLVTTVPWMREGGSRAPMPALISATPVWALTPDGGIVWSPGSPFEIERRSPDGVPLWRLNGPPGPRVDQAALDQREQAVRAAAELLPFDSIDFAAMRQRSDSIIPAVSGLATTPTGTIIAAGAVAPGRDSISYYRIGPDGRLIDSFALSIDARILLAEGDSLLVHRPTMGEPQEVIWMRLQH